MRISRFMEISPPSLVGIVSTDLVSEGVQVGDVIVHRRPLLVDLLPQLLQLAR